MNNFWRAVQHRAYDEQFWIVYLNIWEDRMLQCSRVLATKGKKTLKMKKQRQQVETFGGDGQVYGIVRDDGFTGLSLSPGSSSCRR